MKQPLFINKVEVNASKERIQKLLMTAILYLRSDPHIVNVQEIEAHHYLVTRDRHTLTKQALIKTSLGADFVDYVSKEGPFVYKIRFLLNEQNGKTQMTQSLIFLQENAMVPLFEMVKPIMQRGFKTNLVNFKKIAEDKTL